MTSDVARRPIGRGSVQLDGPAARAPAGLRRGAGGGQSASAERQAPSGPCRSLVLSLSGVRLHNYMRGIRSLVPSVVPHLSPGGPARGPRESGPCLGGVAVCRPTTRGVTNNVAQRGVAPSRSLLLPSLLAFLRPDEPP